MKLPGYETFFVNNPHRGVSIHVKEELNPKICNEFDHLEFSEQVWCTFNSNNNEKILLGNIYRSPNSSEDNSFKILDIIKSEVFNLYDKIYITGDFNYPSIDWSLSKIVDDEHSFKGALKDAFLIQHIDKPTRIVEGQKQNILDLVITKSEDDIISIDHCGHIGKSDHLLLKITTNILKSKAKNDHTFKYDFKKGDYVAYKQWLSNIDWSILNTLTVEESWKFIHSKLQDGNDLFIPKSEFKNRKKKPPWMNHNVCKSIKKKHALFKKYLESNNSWTYILYIRARNEAARLVKNCKREHQKTIAKQCKVNPKVFWNYINSKRKVKDNIAPLWDGEKFITDDKGKADILNKFFSSVFTKEDLSNLPNMTAGENSDGIILTDLRVSQEAVHKKLKSLNPNKSPGPDQLFPKLLVELSAELSLPFTILFNSSLEHGVIPKDWKHAIVTPIFKKGSKTSTNNYRPVSLTSIVCKLLESFVRDSIQTHMEELKLYSDCQHGFRSGRSCISQLLEVIEDFSKLIDEEIPFDVIYLDFKKAFDTVPHQRLIVKMKSYGIEGQLLNWTRSFLENRTQQVKVNKATSDIADVTSGIPQGSILGPILFTIFINDLPDLVNSICKIFADDTKCYNHSSKHQILQDDLLSLESWTIKWQLFFNIEKCLCLYFGRNNPCHEYFLNSKEGPITIKKCYSEKDLGVTFDTELNFNIHINTIVNKANKVLGLIKRNFRDMDETTLILLYKSLVRSLLEYGQSIWSPIFLKQSREIEKVQRRATKLIPAIKDFSYGERLKHLKLPSLKYRRLRGDLIQVFNLFKASNNSTFFTLKNSTTRGHNLKLFKNHSRTNLRKHSFSNRVVDTWNSLSSFTVNAKDVDSFKKFLDGDLFNLLYIHD